MARQSLETQMVSLNARNDTHHASQVGVWVRSGQASGPAQFRTPWPGPEEPSYRPSRVTKVASAGTVSRNFEQIPFPPWHLPGSLQEETELPGTLPQVPC